jgi:hypothetical protein
MILHIVLYQPKLSVPREELSELINALERAGREIPSIRQVRVGRAIDFGFGYEHWLKDQKSLNVAIFEFEDRGGLESYLAHDAHKKLAALFWKTCDQPIIFDVSAIDAAVEDLDVLLGHTPH